MSILFGVAVGAMGGSFQRGDHHRRTDQRGYRDSGQQWLSSAASRSSSPTASRSASSIRPSVTSETASCSASRSRSWCPSRSVARFFVLTRYTIIGRNIYAIGGNPVVARLAGLNVQGYQIGIDALSGAAAGLAGMLLAARTGSGQPISGSEGLELEAITAAVLGGCALAGGKGTIVGGTSRVSSSSASWTTD